MVTRRSDRETLKCVSFSETLASRSATIGRRLSDPEIAAFEIHYRLLRKWGGRINLTGLRSEEAIIERHFLEPIAASGLVTGDGRMVDLGSGNGFPAIPLKVLNPRLDLVLVEASERRSAFLRAVVREARLAGVRVETRRVGSRDDLADLLPCRYLTFRAIRAETILRRGSPIRILEPGGLAILFISTGQLETVRRHSLPGLVFIRTIPLIGSPGSVAAVLEPAG